MAGGKTYDVPINIYVGSQSDNFTNDGRASRVGKIRNKNGEAIMKYNFKSVAKLGLGLRWARMGNEALGSYTGRRLQQQKNQAKLTMASYAIGIKVAGPFGLLYTGADIAYKQFNHEVSVMNQNAAASIIRSKTGNATRRGSRKDGDGL